jgi:hypothetical protein
MDSTYASTVAILRRIFEREIRSLQRQRSYASTKTREQRREQPAIVEQQQQPAETSAETQNA